MNPILQETVVIVFWSFVGSVSIGALGKLLFGWPVSVTYMLSVLTFGPTLAILRGRDRSKDRLEIGERAGVELLALIILLGLGWLGAHYLKL
ncbi:MAG: hypothetical protein AB2385_09545 [Symbiobacterium sp.]|uniref:hypothetical protein n=1 Tax=Symbiobacterium sp. TaxID=1971213 RepID=UPI003463A907